jgi:DNA-binding LacI/PurR family transcriptional regulator
MSSAFWPLLLTAITEQAAAKSYNVLLSTARSEEDVDSAYRSILRGRRVDGIVVGAEQFDDAARQARCTRTTPAMRSAPPVRVEAETGSPSITAAAASVTRGSR